jgi:hypothetical protein
MIEPTEEDLKKIKIWENSRTVLQTEPWGSEYKVVMFSVSDKRLHFVEAAFYKDTKKLLRLLILLDLKPTNKCLVLGGEHD